MIVSSRTARPHSARRKSLPAPYDAAPGNEGHFNSRNRSYARSHAGSGRGSIVSR